MTAISTLSSFLAAVAAMVTVYLMISADNQQRESQRAYFHLTDSPGIRKMAQNDFRVVFCFENVGGHFASNLEAKLFFIDQKLMGEPFFYSETSIANDLFPKEPTPWYFDGVSLPPNTPPVYIVIELQYTDREISKELLQRFYMTWNGVQNFETNPNFHHASLDEKIKIDEYLQENRFFGRTKIIKNKE